MPFQVFPGGFWMNTLANVGEIWRKYAFWNHTWIPNSNLGRDKLWIMAINCGYSSPFRHIELDVVGYIIIYTMGPPFTIAKLVYNSNFTNWFMVPITTVTGAFVDQRSHNWWDWWDPHVCIYIYIHTYIIHTYIHTNIHTYIHACIHTYIHTYICHLYIYIYIGIYIYISISDGISHDIITKLTRRLLYFCPILWNTKSNPIPLCHHIMG